MQGKQIQEKKFFSNGDIMEEFSLRFSSWERFGTICRYLKTYHLESFQKFPDIPRCMIFSNNPSSIWEWKTIDFFKPVSCKKCIFDDGCRWIPKKYIQNWEKIDIFPIKKLFGDDILIEKMIEYTEKLSDIHGPIGRIDHYLWVYKFIIDHVDTSARILEFWCCIGTFMNFLYHEWYENALGVDIDFEFIELWNNIFKNENLYSGDITRAYQEDLYKGQDIVIIMGVFHVSFQENNSDYESLQHFILKALHSASLLLSERGYIFFSTIRFRLEKDIFLKIWIEIIQRYSPWYNTYYYIAQKI